MSVAERADPVERASAEARPLRAVSYDPGQIEWIMAERARLGIDKFDEMWEGELHMNPPPLEEHGRMEFELGAFLVTHVKRHGLGRITRAGVCDPARRKQSHRTPDLIFVAKARLSILASGWCDEGPDLAIEVRSPGDETYEKIPFYGERGVRELLIVDRDTKRVELLRLSGKELLPVSAAPDGSLRSDALQVSFRTLTRPDGTGALEVFSAEDRVEI